MYAVILAGGGGTRLWPLSRAERPKPFLPLLGERSLLQRAVDRLLGGAELGLAPDDVTVVTEARYAGLVSEQLPGIQVLAEPRGRNTAPAIALATLAIERAEDEVMVVLPADQTIGNEGGFRQLLRDAHDELAGGALGVRSPLLTLGVRAERPATEFGYLIPDPARSAGQRLRAHVLKAFEEKPNPGRALELSRLPGVAWNAGIFMWTRGAIREALDRYTSLLGQLDGSRSSDSLLELAYERTQSISIDYAVMEGAARDGRVLMAAMDVGWSDVGTWASLLDNLVGGYAAPSRVVSPGENVELGDNDLLVRRDNGHLAVVVGPASTMQSEQSMALLPDARKHVAAVQALLDRVERQEGRA